jgi:hypothetical protein
MKKYFLMPAVCAILIAGICSCGIKRSSGFSISNTGKAIRLSENGKPVLVYNNTPNSLNGRYVCNNYIHPLYDPDGNVLTEEFPADHPYHRGVFWAWHQLYADGVRLGDGWTNDSISQDVSIVKIEKEKQKVSFYLRVSWKSSVFNESKPFMEEKTVITVHSLESSVRKIDFDIALRGLVKGLQIGGSADPKGYGGLCVRLRTPDSLLFTSVNGRVKPQEMQIAAGPWMDISAPFGEGGKVSGVTILCSPSMQDYPENWILRQKGSMQNVVFPGNGRINVPEDRQVKLKYRIIVHGGDATATDIKSLMQEYQDQAK